MNFMIEIKNNTKELHLASEKSGFIKRLLEGKATKEGYIEYIFNLHAMYEAIETSLDSHLSEEGIKEFATKELYRAELIKKDLEVLAGDKLSEMKLLPSTEACIARINQVNKEYPELLSTYAYVRFIADLFGGRIFPGVLTKVYGIPDNALNYYKDVNIGDVREYVMNYHKKFEKLNLSEDMQKLFGIEISNVYIYNMAISNELDVKLYSSN
ncbi:heme oxygenase (biliverdin-producing) [Clostridium isatidis]|uniref:Heme oxygenase n=1 Tax=Clostridium isatidis TaxID=182773 RepID=A0A343JFS0_9CLOT|nr:biliverdin-producing heme oxygenase [Clostridium isatidis]ASW44378.1 heme oxygenase [Clostridium isatidis]NLZ35260.1 biliverdin-producing heme oxygenase [Clostridiales bacterium]